MNRHKLGSFHSKIFNKWFAIVIMVCFIILHSVKSIPSDGGITPIAANEYEFIWDEFEGVSGDLPGDDILIYGSSFGPFHNNTELETKLRSLESSFPEIFEIFSLGDTYFGRTIYGVKITNEKSYIRKSKILYVAQHHAREQITRENALYFLDKVANHSLDPTHKIWDILNNKEIYIIPSLNLDGTSIIHKFPWIRKSLPRIDDNSPGHIDGYNSTLQALEPRDMNGDGFIDEIYKEVKADQFVLEGYEGIDLNSDGIVGDNIMGGIDPNRNYDFDFANPKFSSDDPISQIYHGDSPNSEIITKHLSSFVNKHKFETVIDLHSGIRIFYLPNIYDAEKDKDDTELFRNITNELTGHSKIPAQYSQVSAGMFIPWVYSAQSKIGFAAIYETYGNNSAIVEVENSNASLFQQQGIWDMFNPPANEVIPVCEEVTDNLLFLAGLEVSVPAKIPGYALITPIFLMGLIFIVMNQMKKRKAFLSRRI